MRSMTGYGRASWSGRSARLVVEVRSLNQRFLEVRFSMPRQYLPVEKGLRKLVEAELERGKVEVFVTRTPKLAATTLEPDLHLARAYVAAWRRLQKALRLRGEIDLAFLGRCAELVRRPEPEEAPAGEVAALRRCLESALRRCVAEREREGRVLERDVTRRLRHLERLLRLLERAGETERRKFARRLREKLAAQASELGLERGLPDLALLVQRSDITEEVVRAKSHVEGLRELLGRDGAVGRRMEFLLQELHRELNTMAAKSAGPEVARLSVEARAEVEKLREQAQNIE